MGNIRASHGGIPQSGMGSNVSFADMKALRGNKLEVININKFACVINGIYNALQSLL